MLVAPVLATIGGVILLIGAITESLNNWTCDGGSEHACVQNKCDCTVDMLVASGKTQLHNFIIGPGEYKYIPIVPHFWGGTGICGVCRAAGHVVTFPLYGAGVPRACNFFEICNERVTLSTSWKRTDDYPFGGVIIPVHAWSKRVSFWSVETT